MSKAQAMSMAARQLLSGDLLGEVVALHHSVHLAVLQPAHERQHHSAEGAANGMLAGFQVGHLHISGWHP